MNVGEVEIKLDGKTETLRSSLGAFKRVNAAGGFTNVINKLLGYDFDYYVTVISAGLNKKPADLADLENAIYKTGLPPLLGDLTKYVGYLANGGKPAEDPGEKPDTGEG
jgi:hypothetical protein